MATVLKSIANLNPGGRHSMVSPESRTSSLEDVYRPQAFKAPVLYSPRDLQQNEQFYPGLRELTVMPGDTMNGILLRQGFKSREIISQNLIDMAYQLNGLEANQILRIGQNVIIPTREFVESQGSLN